MQSSGTRVAMVAMHSSPASRSVEHGGLDVLLRSVAVELASRGVEVDLLVRSDGATSASTVADGVTLHRISAGMPGPRHPDDMLDLTDEFGEAVARLAGRSGSGYDVLHAHSWLSGLAALPVALELGIPFVQSFHTSAPASGAPAFTPEPTARKRSEMFLAGQANAVVTGSAAEVTAVLDDLGAPAERVWVVPPGVDSGFFRPERARFAEGPVRAEFDIDHDRPIIAVVGDVRGHGDQELVIRALAELHSLRGWAPVLVITGEAAPGHSDYLQLLRSIAAEVGVLGEVRFVGALDRERLADLLAIATVTVLPSDTESLPLVALESAASGTPVVGYRGAGAAVAEGLSGLLIDSREPRSWARVLTSLLDDQVALDDLSTSARHHAETCTWAGTATGLLGVYGTLS